MIARNEGAEVNLTVRNLVETLPSKSEIVVVDDGSTCPVRGLPRGVRVIRERGLGVARARNLGVTHTSGDVLVFADAHIRVEAEWWRPLLKALENPKTGATAPTIAQLPPAKLYGFGLRFTGPDLDARWLPRRRGRTFAVPIVPGCCLAMRRKTFHKIGGWDGGLLHRGGVDNEMSIRMWTLGYDLHVAPEVTCSHLFRKKSPYHVGWPEYLHNRLRLAFAHLSVERIAKVIAALHTHKSFGQAMALVLESDVAERRREMLARRVRSDAQYFARFGMKW